MPVRVDRRDCERHRVQLTGGHRHRVAVLHSERRHRARGRRHERRGGHGPEPEARPRCAAADCEARPRADRHRAQRHRAAHEVDVEAERPEHAAKIGEVQREEVLHVVVAVCGVRSAHVDVRAGGARAVPLHMDLRGGAAAVRRDRQIAAADLHEASGDQPVELHREVGQRGRAVREGDRLLQIVGRDLDRVVRVVDGPRRRDRHRRWPAFERGELRSAASPPVQTYCRRAATSVSRCSGRGAVDGGAPTRAPPCRPARSPRALQDWREAEREHDCSVARVAREARLEPRRVARETGRGGLPRVANVTRATYSRLPPLAKNALTAWAR